jgi:hypothetical protein
MHGAERADEDAETDAVPEAEQRDHDAEVDHSFGKEQETVQHCRWSDLILSRNRGRPAIDPVLTPKG